MSVESFIARRYLISKHKINFITIISFLSIAGITIGVAALIVVLSVFNGFGSLVKSFLISFDPHVRIELISPQASSELVEQQFKSINEIKYISPFVSGKILAYREGFKEVVNLKGITEEAGTSIYNLDKNTEFGNYSLAEEAGIPRIMIGLRLADKLQALTGDTITIISPAGIEQVISMMAVPASQKFIVAGIFNSNNNEYDASYIFAGLPYAQNILGYKNKIQGYDLRLSDISYSDEVKSTLKLNLDESSFAVSTWYDLHKELYSFMKIERWVAYIVLCLIIAVATFNILGSLSMSVIEKKRDIGILRSMGLAEKSILKIFMFEGLLIGIIGTAAGAVLGYLICYIHINYNIYPLDPSQYKISALPLELRLSDFFFISGASLLLAYLASLFPAKWAARVNPLEAIKWE